jgi:hypothetical protein
MEEFLRVMAHPEITLLPVIANEQVVDVVKHTDLVRLVEPLEMGPDTLHMP